MSQQSRFKKSREHWKQKAVCRAGQNRYQNKELKRIKAERDKFKKELKESRSRIRQLESQERLVVFQSKTDLVFLALQLFVVARIGFRAVSRVLRILANALGIKKTSLPADHYQLGEQALSGAHSIGSAALRPAHATGIVE